MILALQKLFCYCLTITTLIFIQLPGFGHLAWYAGPPFETPSTSTYWISAGLVWFLIVNPLLKEGKLIMRAIDYNILKERPYKLQYL